MIDIGVHILYIQYFVDLMLMRTELTMAVINKFIVYELYLLYLKERWKLFIKLFEHIFRQLSIYIYFFILKFVYFTLYRVRGKKLL